MERMSIDTLWHSQDIRLWHEAKRTYWRLVRPHLMLTEITLNDLDAALVREMDAQQWYDFLLNQYFPWKYTAPNRLTTTTRQLRTRAETDGLEALFALKVDLFEFDRNDVKRGLEVATKIPGLGVAGASGLLALLFPNHFGTVDQFAVKALQNVSGLEDAARIQRMKPDGLRISDGVILIGIMREKVRQLNVRFSTDYWTPRKVDMLLWTYGR